MIFNASYVEIKPLNYWFENGKIHCNTGASIGFDNVDMTLKEALQMSILNRIVLSESEE